MNKFIPPYQNPYAPYWLVGDKKIYNQFEAARTAFVSNGPAYRFVFLEDQYDQLNWTQEPSETWEELCLAQALKLRQKYKKLKLCFSAGRDSGHVWRVFERAGIPIDELIVIYAQHHPLRVYEHENYVYPTAVKLCQRHPNMKLRVLAMDKEQYDLQFGNSDWLEGPQAQQGRMMFTPYHAGSVITEMDPESGDPNVGYVVGMEKPRIQLQDGNFIFRHLDVNAAYWVYNVPNLEWFFWAPEMPELFLKQCWMAVNHFETYYPGCSPEFVDCFQDSQSVYYDEFCKAIGLGEAMVWECGNGIQKSRDNYHWSLQETIKHAQSNNWTAYKEWRLTMDDLAKNWGHCFNGGDPLKGSIGIWGKPYLLKQQNIIQNQQAV